jgi:hypothetical protein
MRPKKSLDQILQTRLPVPLDFNQIFSVPEATDRIAALLVLIDKVAAAEDVEIDPHPAVVMLKQYQAMAAGAGDLHRMLDQTHGRGMVPRSSGSALSDWLDSLRDDLLVLIKKD